MDLDAYLRRIGHAGERSPTADVLRAIAHRHAMAIPFENVTVLTQGAPDLQLTALEDKLVLRRRGGYCYEQNSLLGAMLAAMGFTVHAHSARVRYGVAPDVVTPRSHMVLRVELPDGPMLVDAGFGSLTLTAPVAMRRHEEQSTSHETVRFGAAQDDYLLQARVSGAWVDLYRFDLSPQLPIDFVQQNWHTATRPGALFANNLIVARPTAQGRRMLVNRTLTRKTASGAREREFIADESQLQQTLRACFDLELTPAELRAVWDLSGRSPGPGAVFD